MQIVKIGGSLFHQPALLNHWLAKFSAEAISKTIILVPGGGPFADLIREAQTDFSLSDTQAHRLAIEAMRQFGSLLDAVCEHAKPFHLSTTGLPASGLHIWLPDALALVQTSLPQDWTVSSDSIALWLAQQYQQPLTLLKSTRELSGTLRQLSANKHIDDAFRAQYLAKPVPLRLLSAYGVTDEAREQDWEIFDD